MESPTKADANNDQRIRAFFSAVTFAIGFGLLVLRQVTLSGIESARNWEPKPCVIEQAEFVRDDDTGERILNMLFSYEYEGQRYTSDRIDMLPGRMGDDRDWEAALKDRHPVGSESICYVDPADPGHAVLDREHGGSGAGNLLLLAFPFLAIGAALGYSCWHDWTKPQAVGELSEVALSPPPRRVSLVTAMAFLLSLPSSIQVAWAFLVGFTFWFSMMDGPEWIADMSAGEGQVVEAVIVSVSPMDQYTFGEQVYECQMRYQVGNRTYSIASYELGQQHTVDDSVEVVHYPARPDASHLKGVRRRSTPSWVVWIPLGVMLVLAFGIVAHYWFNLCSIQLLRIGQLAAATRDSQRVVPSFEVNGVSYFIDQRSPSGTKNQARWCFTILVVRRAHWPQLYAVVGDQRTRDMVCRHQGRHRALPVSGCGDLAVRLGSRRLSKTT